MYSIGARRGSPQLNPIHSCQSARVVRIASLDFTPIEYIVGMTLVVPSSVLVLALLETSRVDDGGRHGVGFSD